MPLTKATTNVVDLNKDTIVNGLTIGRGNGNLTGNTSIGSATLISNTTGNANTAIGASALTANTTGNNNTATGLNALASNTGGGSNTAFGSSSIQSNTAGNHNTATGHNSLLTNTTGSNNTANGSSTLYSNTTGVSNTATGYNALYSNTIGSDNTAIGASALLANTTGIANTATGLNALVSNTTGNNNSAYGVNALDSNTSGNDNTAIGASALTANTTGIQNAAIGANALFSNTNGYANTANGLNALQNNTTGYTNTAIGANALSALTSSINASGIGGASQVTGSNQVQLGDSATTTYAYGAVQNRSDIRDKADVRDTELGLEFINALRPVDFKWDMREDYRPEAPAPVIKPADLKEDATEEEKAKYAQELSAYNSYKVELDKWLEDVKLANINHDGSKKRNRFHHGLIAQEVKAVLDDKGIDFGGFQDHSVKGGDDVLSIGYIELIAPMLKAIQELSAKVAELEAK